MAKNFMVPMKPQERPPDPPNNVYILGNPNAEAVPPTPTMGLHQVHLFAGSSGTGKTTVLFQLIDCMKRGEPFFGRPTQWHPTVYATIDRTELETELTAERVGLPRDFVPHYRFKFVRADPEDKDDHRIERLILGCKNLHPDMKILIIDGITLFAVHGKINDYQEMAGWYQRIGDFARDHDICIIGVTHTPKQREGNKILDPRQMIIGSSSQGGCSGSLFVIESTGKDRWKMHILPRDLPEDDIEITKDDRGRLIEVPSTANNRESTALAIIGAFAPDAPIPAAVLLEKFKESGIGRSKAFQAISLLYAQGKIYKPSYGHYARTRIEYQADAAQLAADESAPPFDPTPEEAKA